MTTPNKPIRIIRKATYPKISPNAKGDLTYQVGYDYANKTLHIRVTENASGGFFSNDWIPLDGESCAAGSLRYGSPDAAQRWQLWSNGEARSPLPRPATYSHWVCGQVDFPLIFCALRELLT